MLSESSAPFETFLISAQFALKHHTFRTAMAGLMCIARSVFKMFLQMSYKYHPNNIILRAHSSPIYTSITRKQYGSITELMNNTA